MSERPPSLNAALSTSTSGAAACAATRRKLLDHLVRERELLICDAMRILGSRDRAEDVVQDAAIRCLNSRAIGRDLDSPRGMLRRMVRNLALDHVRRQTRENTVGYDGFDPASFAPTADQQITDCQRLKILITALRALPEAHQRVFLNHRLDARRQNDIARELGVSPARIHAIISRTHAKLSESLREYA